MSPGIEAEIRRRVRPEYWQRAREIYLRTDNLYVMNGQPLDPREVEHIEAGRGCDQLHCATCGHLSRSHADPGTCFEGTPALCARPDCACAKDAAALRLCRCGDAFGHAARGGPWWPGPKAGAP